MAIIDIYFITGVYQRNPITALHSNFLNYKPMNSLNLCVDSFKHVSQVTKAIYGVEWHWT